MRGDFVKFPLMIVSSLSRCSPLPPPSRSQHRLHFDVTWPRGDLGCYGQKIIQTPNLDRMAKEGTRFAGLFRHTVCAPSARCS